jgi:Cu/Ag efflux protein CusF
LASVKVTARKYLRFSRLPNFSDESLIMRNFLTFLFLAFGVFTLTATAQPVLKSLPGEVKAIDAAGSKITVKTQDGEAVVSLEANTDYRRIAPDKLSDPRSAVASALSEIGVGDKIVAVGILSDDKKSISQTRRIFLLKQDDLAKKQEADRERWNTRGIAGRVTAVNAAGNEITVTLRGGMGAERTTVVAAGDKTIFKRYAPNSVKYSDAKTSSLAEIKVGDQLRAVGERSADNARLTAEEVLFGSFRTVAGKIETIDAAKREVTVKDLQTNQSVTVQVNDETLLRRFPAEMAQRMAQFQAMRASGQMPPGAGGQGGQMPPQRPAGAGEGGSPTGRPQGMGGGMGRGDIDSMLERMPALTLTELKVGDAIAANSSVGADVSRVTAIKFVAGIEPFLTAPQAPAGGGRPQSSPQINIPGLDGFGAP